MKLTPLLRTTSIGLVAGVALAANANAQTPTSSAEQVAEAPQTVERDVIVVTAQRREEALKDVPIAVSVLDGDTLSTSNISNTNDLGLITPGFTMTINGGFANPNIRGVGTTVTAAGSDANVAIYVDGVYLPSQLGNLFDLNSIDNIQVLKGPQGTLFGRNATGGAVLVNTLTPGFTPSVKLGASYGSFDEIKVAGYVNTPITDTLAFNLAASYKDDDGYQFNETTGNKVSEATSYNVRSRLLWQVTPELEALVTGFYSHQQDSGYQARQVWEGNHVIRQTQPNFPLATEFGTVRMDTDPNLESETYGASLALTYDLGHGSISSMTSWLSIDPSSVIDVDGTSNPTTTTRLTYPEKTFTQELIYTSDFDGPFNVIAGVFYYDDRVERVLRNGPGATAAPTSGNDIDVDTEAAAVFGELSWDITDRLNAIIGLRQSAEKKHIRGNNLNAPTTLDTGEEWDATTARAALTYSLNDESSVYASFSQGFKSGVYDSALSATPVDPEYVDAYEVGYKYFGANSRFEASAFFYDYSDIQVQVTTLLPNGAISTVLRNASDAEIYGLELNYWAELTENLRVQFGGAYTRARYVDFLNALLTVPRPGGGNLQVSGDASGNQMIRTPELTAFAVLSYYQPIESGAIEVSVTPSYSSSFFWDPGSNFETEARTILNADISWISPDETIRASIWGKNLLDEHYPSTLATSTTGAFISYARPLTFGVSLGLQY